MESAFSIVAEPNRRAILSLLLSSERSVGELEAELDLSQPSVSKHLRVLREAGFVESRIEAQRRLYRLRPEPLMELDAWLVPFRRFWSRHVDALERHRGLDEGRRLAALERRVREAVRGRTMSSKRGKAGVTLLSGGNPEIAMADGDAPVKAYIAAIPGWKREVARRVDALVVRTVPKVRKSVKWNSPFYGLEGQGYFLNFHCFTKYLKVAFFRGASLDPLPPGGSKVKGTRYLDIHEDDALDEKLVTSWIKQASELPGWVP